MATPMTDRDRAKADRYEALLHEAARLFATHGFGGVSLDDLGGAVGISGPAVYRHFANKQAVLGAVLLRVSERLLDGGRAQLSAHTDAHARLDGLIAFHVDFAVRDTDVIRVQDRDLASLSDEDRAAVRRLQRSYVELWVGVLADIHPDRTDETLRVAAHAAFGLINSTPHSARGVGVASTDGAIRDVLTAMASAALRA